MEALSLPRTRCPPHAPPGTTRLTTTDPLESPTKSRLRPTVLGLRLLCPGDGLDPCESTPPPPTRPRSPNSTSLFFELRPACGGDDGDTHGVFGEHSQDMAETLGHAQKNAMLEADTQAHSRKTYRWARNKLPCSLARGLGACPRECRPMETVPTKLPFSVLLAVPRTSRSQPRRLAGSARARLRRHRGGLTRRQVRCLLPRCRGLGPAGQARGHAVGAPSSVGVAQRCRGKTVQQHGQHRGRSVAKRPSFDSEP